ncbi:MAG: hypothetical protein AB7O62_12265 [Pirellulales bacterium]
MPQQLLAGAATSNITPRLGISINGNLRDGTALQIHDELHARCLVLDNGVERIGLVVVDSCAVPGEIHEAAKHLVHGNTSFPIDRIIISATHTHSAPTVTGVFQSDPDLEYQEFLTLRIADGLRRAINNLRPARVAWAVGSEPTQVFNRRWKKRPGTIPADPFGGTSDLVQMNPSRGSDDLLEPSGPIDPDVTLLSVQDAHGKPLALFANYSLHYVGDVGPGHVSADYFAAFSDRMQQLLQADRLDPPFVAMMSNGTSGNINNVNFRVAGGAATPPYTRIKSVAYTVADAAFQALQSAEYHDWVPIAMREARLTLGRRLPAPAEVDRAKFILEQAKPGPLATLEEAYARETYIMADLPPTIETVIQAARIGELGIVTLPCETFVETGLAIKAASPFKPTLAISLANDYAGYLPTVEHHRLGGYETWRARSSFLEVEAEPKIRGKLLEMLAEVERG